MKYIFLLVLTFSQFVLGAQTITGYVSQRNGDFYLNPRDSQNAYLVISQNADVETNLSKLSSGDFVAGNGAIDTVNKRITLTSIDYVGLRRLLGTWTGADGTLTFKNFTTMRFTPPQASSFGDNLSAYQKEFRYSVSPSEGNEWALFLSDHKNTSFATVEFNGRSITMKIFESDSGNIIRTLTLERR